MNRVFRLALVMMGIMTLAACGNSATNSNQEIGVSTSSSNMEAVEGDSVERTSEVAENNTSSEETMNDEASSNILVVYFSRVGTSDFKDDVDVVSSASLNMNNEELEGNAEILAKIIQEETGGELFQIVTVNPYPSDYNETTDQAKIEQDEAARPELTTHIEHMEEYDTIFLVYPNWWGTLPMPVCTFLEAYDFTGKTILPLCTHGGSRMGSSENMIASLCSATLMEGLDIPGDESSLEDAHAAVIEWVQRSGIAY